MPLVLSIATRLEAQDSGLDILEGETIYQEGFLITLSEIYRQRSNLYEGSHRTRDPLDRVQRESRTTLGINYAPLPEVTLSALAPYVWRELRFDDVTGRETWTGQGLGDIAFLSKYRMYKQDWHLGSFNWSAIAGVELPTGATHEEDGGIRLPPNLQPGSGSWDAIFATAATLEQDRWKFNGVLLYQLNTEGAQDFEFGELLVAELSVSNRFWIEKFPGPSASAGLGIQWRHEFAAVQDGDRLRNSGGDTFVVKPTLVVHPRPEWDIVLSADVPVWRDLRGEQLGLDFSIFFGVGYRF